MILKVEHRTLFAYSSPIYETATEVRLHPDCSHASQQRCSSFTLEIEHSPTIFEYTDFYGNKVHHFNILQSHDRVSILATSIVETGKGTPLSSYNEEILLMDPLRRKPICQFRSRHPRLYRALLPGYASPCPWRSDLPENQQLLHI